MRKKIILIVILCMLLVMPSIAFAANEEPAKIADVEFKNVLRGMFNKGVYDEVYPSELAEFTGEMDFSDMGITDLRGLEYFVNVTSFDFSHNEITRLPTKIADMDKMEELNLSFNNMYELPRFIADAPSLKILDVSGNKMKTIPNRMQEMAQLESLNISGNRIEVLPHRVIYLHLKDFNCNYNFIDFSEGTKSRKDLDKMEVSGKKEAFKQLIKLPAITYVTDNGVFKVKWRKAYDVPFYDGTSAKVVGYTVLMDGKFLKTVGPDETEYEVKGMKAGVGHKITVSPDYNVDGFGDYPIRGYITIEGIKYGGDGPFIPENEEPVAFDYQDESIEAAEPVVAEADMAKDGLFKNMSSATMILIGAAALLIIGLIVVLIIFLKKKSANTKK
jgi:hypothetical protein